MSVVEGRKSGGGTAELPLNADGTAVACEIENVNLDIDTTGLATSAAQTDGSQKTKVVDASGNVAPAGDTAARAAFVKVTDGTNTQPTGDAVGRAIFTKVTDGTNTQPAGDAATRPVFVELSDGSGAVGTAGNPVRVSPTAVVASASTDAGQNLSLSDTNAYAFGTSAAATIGVLVAAPAENTATVYVALGSGVTSGSTGKGYPLVPGASVFLPGVLNSNLVYAITASATQNVHALAI